MSLHLYLPKAPLSGEGQIEYASFPDASDRKSLHVVGDKEVSLPTARRTPVTNTPLSHVAILNRGDVGWIEGRRVESWRWDEIIAETSAEKPGLVITWKSWVLCAVVGGIWLVFLRALGLFS